MPCCFPAECKYIPLLYQLYLSQCIPCVCLSLSTLFVTRCAWAIAPNGLPETCWTWQPCWVQIYFSHYINFVSSTVFVSVHQIVLSHIINCICLSSSTVFVSVYQLCLSQLINCICLSLSTVFLTSSNSAQLTAIDLLIVEAPLLACWGQVCLLCAAVACCVWLAVCFCRLLCLACCLLLCLASFSQLKRKEFRNRCFSHSSFASFVWCCVMTMFKSRNKLWFTAYMITTHLASVEGILRDMLDFGLSCHNAGILSRVFCILMAEKDLVEQCQVLAPYLISPNINCLNSISV